MILLQTLKHFTTNFTALSERYNSKTITIYGDTKQLH